jgi:hypothetical protein
MEIMEPLATKVMNEEEYRVWWQLHRRASLGEPLSDEEKVAYEGGLGQLHSEQTLRSNDTPFQRMEARLAELEAEQDRLERWLTELSTKINKRESPPSPGH